MSVISLARKATKLAALPFGVGEQMRSGDVAILLYHRVGAGDREIDLDVSAFEQHMAYLAALRMARTLDDALADDVPGNVVVTIDDGFRDFYEHALPILVRYEIPAVIYLATGLVAGESHEPTGDNALSWSQLREAVSTGLVGVGSHTHGHVDLSTASEEVADEEMRRSKGLIEDRLGVSCRHFAYPWAVAGPAAERAARRHFRSAALLWQTNRRGRIDRFRLGRTPILRGDGAIFFRAKVSGRLDKEASVYRLLRRGPWRRG
jgi:peptidoglycan/xylan/chitin deacetylase (PgdA/CDA1 family)